MAALVLFFLLGISTAFSAKDGSHLQLQLDINSNKWLAQNAVSYHMVISRRCFCLKDALGPFKLSVNNEKIVSVEPENEFTKDLPTVAGLFKMIQEAIDSKAEVIRVKYDPRLGFPTSVFIDKSLKIADEEIGFDVAVSNIVKGAVTIPIPSSDPGNDNGFIPKLHRLQFDRWTKRGMKSYKYKLERLCFCKEHFVGPFIITVKHNKVIQAVFEKNPSKPIPTEISKALPTIPGLFRIISDEAAKAAKIKVKYNARYGYPLEAKIDRIKIAVDDEITYKAKLLHHSF